MVVQARAQGTEDPVSLVERHELLESRLVDVGGQGRIEVAGEPKPPLTARVEQFESLILF